MRCPRTYHLEDSRLLPGETNPDRVPFSAIQGKYLVIEEKVDGVGVSLGFNDEAELVIEHRGHAAHGPVFAPLKAWAAAHLDLLWTLLEDRYVLLGEWMYPKHTVFYDRLPAYLLESDVYDRTADAFLSTHARQKLLQGSCVTSVPVLAQGAFSGIQQIRGLILPSLYKSDEWVSSLTHVCEQTRQSFWPVWAETDHAREGEGLYIKVETQAAVTERYKYIRPDFLKALLESGSHWMERPLLPNQLEHA